MGPASPAGVHRQGPAVSPLGRPAVRPAAVAGSFYPSDADELTAVVDTLLGRARLRASEGAAGPAPVALVVPHAGYVYSGPVAASAYDWLRDSPMRRVAALGPAQYVPLTGDAVPAASAFATPIGEVPVEVHTCAVLAERQECVTVDDRPHRPEHSIEVQLPFLQRVLAHGWTCVPLVVGATPPAAGRRRVGHPVRRRRPAAGRQHRPVPLPRPADRAATRSAYGAGSRGPGCRRDWSPRRVRRVRSSWSPALGAPARARRATAAPGHLCRGWRRPTACGRLWRVRPPAVDGSQLTVTGG